MPLPMPSYGCSNQCNIGMDQYVRQERFWLESFGPKLTPGHPKQTIENLQKCHHFNEHNCVSAGCCWFQTHFSHRPSCFWPQTSEFARNFDSVKSQNSAPQLFPPKSAISSLFDGFDLMASDFEGYEALLDSSGLF